MIDMAKRHRPLAAHLQQDRPQCDTQMRVPQMTGAPDRPRSENQQPTLRARDLLLRQFCPAIGVAQCGQGLQRCRFVDQAAGPQIAGIDGQRTDKDQRHVLWHGRDKPTGGQHSIPRMHGVVARQGSGGVNHRVHPDKGRIQSRPRLGQIDAVHRNAGIPLPGRRCRPGPPHHRANDVAA